jgi:hypothetical protein
VNSSIGLTLPEQTRSIHPGQENHQTRTGKAKRQRQGLQLADEIDYIQSRAAQHDGRLVSVGPLVLFSTESGDAWLLDPADHLAARLARGGDPESIHFQETDTTFAIGWKGNYRIDGDAFVFIDRDSGRLVTILGYPTRRLTPLG